jgi:hypothetical protein
VVMIGGPAAPAVDTESGAPDPVATDTTERTITVTRTTRADVFNLVPR